MNWTFTRAISNITGLPTIRETINLDHATDEELIELWVYLTERLAGGKK